jgi:CRP/FNR family transcriptional regulator, cyclic AMP receptor protein
MPLTRDAKVGLIAATHLFEGVDPADLPGIADRAIEVEFEPGHVIARQGEIGTGFFIVVDGSARITREGATIATAGPGDFFGELSILDGRPRIAQVVAEERTTCIALASWDLEAVIAEQPRVALAILRELAGRLRDLTEARTH